MMISKRLFILVAFFGLFLAKELYPSNIEGRDDDFINLRLKSGVVTEVEFPEDIANVTKSVPSGLLQIETSGNRLYLFPKENFRSLIHVVTQDNFSYSLRLAVTEAESSSQVKIKKPTETKGEPRNKRIANTIKLMKALINGEPFQGVASSKLHAKEIFNDGRIRIVIDEVYEFQGGVKAIVLTFENLSYKPIVIPIEQIELPGLLAISVKSQILEARPRDIHKEAIGHTQKAYMIVEGLNQ